MEGFIDVIAWICTLFVPFVILRFLRAFFVNNDS